MSAVKIRRPEFEETPLSRDEMLVALREGHTAVGLADSLVIVTPKVQHVFRIGEARQQPPAAQPTGHGVTP